MSSRFSAASKALLLAVMLLFLCTPSKSSASDAALWHPDDAGGAYGNFGNGTGPAPYRGQTFLAEASGVVQEGWMRMGQWTAPPDWVVRIELRPTDGNGLPTSEVLDFQDVPSDSIPVGLTMPVHFSLEGGVRIHQGTTYSLVVYPVPLVTNGDPFYLNGEEGTLADYAGGSAVTSGDGIHWQALLDTDYGFRISVDTRTPTQTSSFGQIKLRY
jgi:hypothetical protein